MSYGLFHFQKIQNDIQQRQEQFQGTFEEVSDETLAKRTRLETLAARLTNVTAARDSANIKLIAALKEEKESSQELYVKKQDCQKQSNQYDSIRTKLDGQTQEIEELTQLLAHHPSSPPLPVVVVTANVTLPRVKVKAKKRKPEILKHVNIKPHNLETKHGSLMKMEAARVQRETKINEEHYKKHHVANIDFEPPVQDASFETIEKKKKYRRSKRLKKLNIRNQYKNQL